MPTSSYWKSFKRKWQSSGYGSVSNIKAKNKKQAKTRARRILRKQDIGYKKRIIMRAEKQNDGKYLVLYNIK